VSAWSNVSNEMIVTQVNGIFKSGYRLFGAVTNAAYTIVSTGDSSLKIVNIDVTPTPNTANVNSAYGFDVDIDEYPNIV